MTDVLKCVPSTVHCPRVVRQDSSCSAGFTFHSAEFVLHFSISFLTMYNCYPAHGDVSFYLIYKSADVTLLLPSCVLSYFTQLNTQKAFFAKSLQS